MLPNAHVYEISPAASTSSTKHPTVHRLSRSKSAHFPPIRSLHDCDSVRLLAQEFYRCSWRRHGYHPQQSNKSTDRGSVAIVMNPFQGINKELGSPVFKARVIQAGKKFL